MQEPTMRTSKGSRYREGQGVVKESKERVTVPMFSASMRELMRSAIDFVDPLAEA